MKKWFDDWKTTENIEGDGIITLTLPHAGKSGYMLVVTKRAHNRKHLKELIQLLDSALSELTKEDK